MLRFYHNQENFGALVLRRKWQHRQNVIGGNLICIGSSFVDHHSQLTQAQAPALFFKAQIKSNSGNFLACVSGISPAAWIEEVQMV